MLLGMPALTTIGSPLLTDTLGGDCKVPGAPFKPPLRPNELTNWGCFPCNICNSEGLIINNLMMYSCWQFFLGYIYFICWEQFKIQITYYMNNFEFAWIQTISWLWSCWEPMGLCWRAWEVPSWSMAPFCMPPGPGPVAGGLELGVSATVLHEDEPVNRSSGKSFSISNMSLFVNKSAEIKEL